MAIGTSARQLAMLRLSLFGVAGGAGRLSRRTAVGLVAVDALGVAGRCSVRFRLVAAVASLSLSTAVRLMAVGASLVTLVRFVGFASMASLTVPWSSLAGVVR